MCQTLKTVKVTAIDCKRTLFYPSGAIMIRFTSAATACTNESKADEKETGVDCMCSCLVQSGKKQDQGETTERHTEASF